MVYTGIYLSLSEEGNPTTSRYWIRSWGGGEEEQEREGDGVKSIQSEYQIYLLGFRG